MPTILIQYLPYLFEAARTIPQILEYIQKMRTSLQQSEQWPPEVEEAFNKELQDLKDNPPPHWKINAEN